MEELDQIHPRVILFQSVDLALSGSTEITVQFGLLKIIFPKILSCQGKSKINKKHLADENSMESQGYF